MTGIAGNESNVFVSGKDGLDASSTLRVYRCSPLPLDDQTIQFQEHLSLAAYGTVHDIAYEGINNIRADGDIWIACDDAQNPIKALNSSGQVVDEVPASIGIGSDIWGLAYEKGTSRFLWVSNQTDNKIYKVDVDGTTDIQKDQNFIVDFKDNFKVNVTAECIKLFISYSGNSQVTVSDIKGRVCFSFTAKSNTWYTIQKQVFAPGMNIIRVKNYGKTVVKKFISIK